MQVETGDVFFTRSNSLLGRLIRWAETDPGEIDSLVNHSGNYVADGEASSADTVQAVGHVTLGPLAEGTEAYIYRPVPPLTKEEKIALRSYALSYVGDRYGWWKLLFHLADRFLFKGKKILSSLLFINSRPICSFLTAHVEAMVNRTFGMDPDVADPDNMIDYCDTHPEQWQFIGKVSVHHTS